MTYVVFETPGLIDNVALFTMGVSAKETDEPIGMFGTGLKYAIAVLMREGATVWLQRGAFADRFECVNESFRGKHFDFIYLKDSQLPFTTDLGMNWNVGHAYRELESNTRDELGSSYETEVFPSTTGQDITRFIIDHNEFLEIFRRPESIFLPDHCKPVYSDSDVKVYLGTGETQIYRQGIRIYKPAAPMLFSYDCPKAELTEDRTLRDLEKVQRDISYMMGHNMTGTAERKAVLKQLLTVDDNYFEAGCTPQAYGVGESTAEFILELANNGCFVRSPWFHAAKAKLGKDFEPNLVDMNKIQEMQLAKAISFLEEMGEKPTEYPILVCDNLGNNILGRAYEEQILLSERIFHQGTKQVVSTLLEEYLHLKYSLRDCTYDMQTYLFDRIISLMELVKGEPI